MHVVRLLMKCAEEGTVEVACFALAALTYTTQKELRFPHQNGLTLLLPDGSVIASICFRRLQKLQASHWNKAVRQTAAVAEASISMRLSKSAPAITTPHRSYPPLPLSPPEHIVSGVGGEKKATAFKFG